MFHNPPFMLGLSNIATLRRTVLGVVYSADEQGCDVTCAYYPEDNVLAFGLNGMFDIDTAIGDTDDATLQDVLSTPATTTTHPTVVSDVASDIVLTADVPAIVSKQQVRHCMDIADHSGNTVSYYERRDGTTVHERVYHPVETEGGASLFSKSFDLEQELEDLEIDADEIIAELDAEEDE